MRTISYHGLRVEENFQHANKIKKSKEKSSFNMELGKAPEKTVERKLRIRSRRSTTLLCHPELEGACSAGTKGVSMTAGICKSSPFLFGGPCERSTPFPLRPYEFAIFRTTEIPFAHWSHKYFSLNLLISQNLLQIFCHPNSTQMGVPNITDSRKLS